MQGEQQSGSLFMLVVSGIMVERMCFAFSMGEFTLSRSTCSFLQSEHSFLATILFVSVLLAKIRCFAFHMGDFPLLKPLYKAFLH